MTLIDLKPIRYRIDGWTREQVEVLRRLRAEGKTYPEIAQVTGHTSEAVRNKAMRIGLRHPLNSVWTDEKIEELKELWAQGFSASECGKRLGVGRNAVIGKVHRLGLSGRKPLVRKERTKRAPIFDPIPIRPTVKPLNRELLELKADECRWPYGDGPFTFCGHWRPKGAAYCCAHSAIAYNPRVA